MRQRRNDLPQRDKPWRPTFTLAARLLAQGQRLRADETVTVTSFALAYAAQRAADPRLAPQKEN